LIISTSSEASMNKDLNNLSTDELGRLFPIIISEYNPDWKNMFSAEKQIIERAVGLRNTRRIEHIGSTAVPGLCAKPTIDILVEIKDDTDTDLIINKLKLLDYHYIPKPENPPPHMMFAKGYSDQGFTGQTFHIHVRYKGDWDEPVFRDYLIQNPKAAKEYSELKLELSIDYVNDREKYTDSKTEFIARIIKAARKELENKTYF
jgi:GrpB-like predicted nucleotidyltransferase (UPF0157 family)